MGKVHVGRPAPDFECTAVVDGRLKECSLSAYSQAHHWVILIFFPKAWSFICPTEIRAFSARLEEFLYTRTAALVFASTDSEYCLKAWHATSEMEGGLGGVHVPLLSDCAHRLSREYGVLIEDQGVAQRALFIIDPKGIIRAITVNDADVGRSVDETLRVLDALKFKDEFGEGCPVDGKKGDEGIKTSAPREGRLELKQSWSDWARPKLQRAWSGTSQRSVGSASNGFGNGGYAGRLAGVDLGDYHASVAKSGNASPLVSPTSAASAQAQQMDAALLAQHMENMSAILQNSGVGVAS